MTQSTTEAIRETLNTGAAIICATERLARDLRIAYSMAMREEGRLGWPSPAIFGFPLWVRNSWVDLWPTEQLLYGAQTLALWMQAVESNGGTAQRLLSPAAAARAAMRVDDRVIASCIANDALTRTLPSLDEEAFDQWRRHVAEQCAAHGWVRESQLVRLLTAAIDNPALRLPERIVMVGFLEPTRAQRWLVDAMRERAVEVEWRDRMGAAHVANVEKRRCATRRQQYRAIASAVRRRLGASSMTSDTRIAILVDDVDGARDDLEAELREQVAPHVYHPDAFPGRKPWRFAQGQRFTEHPMIATALDVICLDGGRVDLSVLSRIALGPWLFPDGDSTERAALDWKMRKSGGARFGREQMGRHAEALASKGNRFCERVSCWLEGFDGRPSRALPSAWASHWTERLAEAEWTRAASESSEYQQAFDAWMESLDALRAMDSQLGAMSHGMALSWLREILAERRFQPAVDYLQPIHVMSYDDIPGMEFDFIAVADATSTCLPVPVRSPGFVANDILAEHGDLKASPEGALQRATRWWEHVQTLAPEILVMAPRVDDTGAALSPSSIFGQWDHNQEDLQAPPRAPSAHVDLVGSGEEALPPIESPQDEGVAGGTAILADMAATPFISVMRHRLGLRPFPRAEQGITPDVQGNAVHRVLEHLWKGLRTQQALKDVLEAGAIDGMVEEIVDLVCEREALIPVVAFGKALAAAEQDRIRRVVTRWMEMEGRRSHAFEVVGCELRARAEVSGLPIEMRIDRIDRVFLPDGSERILVLDYKTGGAQMYPTVWNADRMQEPQLPAYAACADLSAHGISRVDGIGFARVLDGDPHFLIRTNFAGSLVDGQRRSGAAGGESDWGQVLLGWRASVEALARRFMAGEMSLDRWRLERAIYHRDLLPLGRKDSQDVAERVADTSGAGALGSAPLLEEEPPF